MNGAVHAVEMAERDERAERPERPELHAVTSPGRIDAVAAEAAAAQFLTALGVPIESEHLHATPGRMARAWAEMLTPRPFEMTTFPNDEGYAELVVARDIPVRSLRAHHLLPFSGRGWVA